MFKQPDLILSKSMMATLFLRRIITARAKVEEVRNYLYDLSFFAPYCSMGLEASLRMSRSYCLYFPVCGVVAQRTIKLTNIIPLKIILPQAMDA